MAINKNVKFSIIIISALILIVLAFAIFCAIAFPSTVSDAIKSVVSPSGDYIAVASVTNGGATTDFGVVVTLIESHNLVNNSAKCIKVYSAYHTDNVDIQWINDNELEIRASSEATDIKKAEKYNEVHLSYRTDLSEYSR